MEAKEKAKALVDRFLFEVDQVNPLEDIFESAKKCALICVDEILEEIEGFPYAYKYWGEVKKEIDKL